MKKSKTLISRLLYNKLFLQLILATFMIGVAIFFISHEHLEVVKIRQQELLGDLLRRACRIVQAAADHRRQPEHQQTDREAGNNLIGLKLDHRDRKDRRDKRSGRHSGKKSKIRIAQFVRRDRRRKSSRQHQPLKSDIDHAGALGKHPAQSGKNKRRRQPYGRKQQDHQECRC